jgi:hypothetical protein
MEGEIVVNPKLVIERVQKAMNVHDVDAFIACFDPPYYTEQPLHPDRAFRGRDRLLKEWSDTFRRIPNFKATLLRCSVDRDVVWAEWQYTGTEADKTKLDLRGVTIQSVRDNRIVWGRMYMEPVQKPGGGIEAVTTQVR